MPRRYGPGLRRGIKPYHQRFISVVAGSPNDLTITAADTLGSIDTNYDGVKSIVFSGAPASLNPVQNPTVTDQNGVSQDFGTPTGIAFKKGVASVSGKTNNGQMRIFRAGSFTVSATDGTIASTGSGQFTCERDARSALRI